MASADPDLVKVMTAALVLMSINPLGAKMAVMYIGRQAAAAVLVAHQLIPQSLVIHGVNKPL